jgi:hypothetical protein
VNLWRISVATLAAANVLDVQSSWGKRELNPALSNASGTFGAQGAAIKSACQGGLLAIEYLVTRHHPSGKLYKALSLINFGAAGAMGGVAAHNYTIAPPPR